MRSRIAIIACVLALGIVDYAIARKERLLAEGAVVFLELAPVDPRSLMQGDYMALRFRIAEQVYPRFGNVYMPADGRLVVALDERRVAAYRRLRTAEPLQAGELALRYRVRNGEMKFATNAFFFQEGTEQRYTGARYGEFRVAPDGELLLTGLRDRDLRPL
jgi:uncharacterized membrane-anchored protein